MTAACPACGTAALTPAFEHRGAKFLRCAGCGSLIQAPGDGAVTDEYYDRNYHAARGHGGAGVGIDSAKRETFTRYLRKLLAGAPAAGKRYFEVGCGTGDATAAAAALGFEAIGMDIAPSAIATARERFPGVTYLVGSASDYDAPDDRFDVIALFDMIEHVPDAHALLGNLARMLAPGGSLLVVTPDAASFSARMLGSRWFHTMKEHVLIYSLAGLDAVAATAGLKRIEGGFAWKWINLEMLARHATEHAHILGGRAISRTLFAIPAGVRARVFPFNIGEFFAVYRK
ncbi:class I SAM-dependent methyltransferase [bacterium]|nr:class I SAM-dependent methyltransferase [bacterium]